MTSGMAQPATSSVCMHSLIIPSERGGGAGGGGGGGGGEIHDHPQVGFMCLFKCTPFKKMMSVHLMFSISTSPNWGVIRSLKRN